MQVQVEEQVGEVQAEVQNLEDRRVEGQSLEGQQVEEERAHLHCNHDVDNRPPCP